FFFFFSSRRRHTRSDRDWSSDVCSSDLSYTASQRWPVILFLHGAGERGDDGLLQTQVGLGAAVRQNAARFPAIIVFPQMPAESAWTGTPAQVAIAALEQVSREFQVDSDRLYLTGLSMGGN